MKLKEYLKRHEISQTDFAKVLGINLRTVQNIIAGKEPRLKLAVKIEKATFGKVTCEDLIEDETYTQKKRSKEQPE